MPDVRSRRAVARWLSQWWSTPVDYAGQVEYFAKRSLDGLMQLLIGLAVMVIGAVVVVVQFSSVAPHSVWARVVAFAFAASLFAGALAWWLGSWPSRRVSRVLVVYLDVGIVVASLLNITGLAGVFCLSAMILVSSYLVFFDGPKILVLHTTWVIASMVLTAIKIGAEVHGDGPLIAARALAGAALAVAPVATQFGIWVLRSDANEATTDPLTGVLNRRGLSIQIDGLVGRAHGRTCEIVVAIIDLDRFKTVNDAFGHAVGDEVLVRSARRLESVLGGALVARVGGEEFVVADVIHPADIPAVGERLRSAVAGDVADHAPVTASVGVVHAPVSMLSSAIDQAAALTDLIGRADDAMFTAKRAGGNKVAYSI